MTDFLQIDKIVYSRFMVREIDGKAISDLKESIRVYGVLQPILVFKNESGRYEVICGNHRLCAARGVGLTSIPTVIKSLANPNDAILLALNENVHRLEMNPLREGEIYDMLLQHHSVDVLVEEIGKTKYYIESRISMWKNLHNDLRMEIGQTLTIGNAIALSKQPKDIQIEIFKRLSEDQPRKPASDTPYGSFGGGGGDPVYEYSPFCVCKKCGSRHLRGVSVQK